MSQNLSFSSGLGVVFLTTVIGGLVGIGLSAVLIPILKITNFEGGAGYFTLSITLLGIAGGFIIGLIAALTMAAEFGAVLMRSASITVALAVAVAIVTAIAQRFEDKGPHLDGESIRLEVEYKCPQAWKLPDASEIEHTGCWLQKYREEGTLEQNPIVSGKLTWLPNEILTASCVVPLELTARQRYLLIYTTGNKYVTMEIPLPRHPGPEFLQWSDWTTKGFIPQKQSPVQPDAFAFRFRIRKESEYAPDH